MTLRHDWAGPLMRLYTVPQPYPFWRLREVIDIAGRFIDRWADWGELAGMRPAHLLKNDPADAIGRGLAWRGDIDVVCFPRRFHLVTQVGSLLMVYRFHPDGRTTWLAGDERREVLGAYCEMDAATPTLRAKLVASGGC